MRVITFFPSPRPRRAFTLRNSFCSLHAFLLTWFFFVLLHTSTWTPGTAVVAQTLTGANGCKGFDLLQSKFCGYLGNSVLGSVNFTKPLQALFLTNMSTVTILGTPMSIAFVNIQSAKEFDSIIMEKVVLPKLDYLTKLWFQCSYDHLGIQWLSSWFCNVMFNLRVEKSKEPCFVQDAQIPLCASTRDDVLASAERHYVKDGSCDTTSTGRTKFQKHLQTIKESFHASSDFSGGKGACLEGKNIEPSNGYCGWANTPGACDARQRLLQRDVDGSLSSTQLGWVIGGSVAGGVVLLAVVVVLLKRKRGEDRATPPPVAPSLSLVSAASGHPGAPVLSPAPPLVSPPAIHPAPPAPPPTDLVHTYSMYHARDVESILPEDSASNIGLSRRNSSRTQLSRLMVELNNGESAFPLPSPSSPTVLN